MWVYVSERQKIYRIDMLFNEENTKNLIITNNGTFKNTVTRVYYFYHYSCKDVVVPT